jgi:hypothetical protein
VVSGSRVMGVTFVELSTPSSRLVAALTGTGGDPGRAYVIHVYRQPDVVDYGCRCDYEFCHTGNDRGLRTVWFARCSIFRFIVWNTEEHYLGWPP